MHAWFSWRHIEWFYVRVAFYFIKWRVGWEGHQNIWWFRFIPPCNLRLPSLMQGGDKWMYGKTGHAVLINICKCSRMDVKENSRNFLTGISPLSANEKKTDRTTSEWLHSVSCHMFCFDVLLSPVSKFEMLYVVHPMRSPPRVRRWATAEYMPDMVSEYMSDTFLVSLHGMPRVL